MSYTGFGNGVEITCVQLRANFGGMYLPDAICPEYIGKTSHTPPRPRWCGGSVQAVQQGLKYAGLYPGPVDGLVNPALLAAMMVIAKQYNVDWDGTPFSVGPNLCGAIIAEISKRAPTCPTSYPDIGCVVKPTGPLMEPIYGAQPMAPAPTKPIVPLTAKTLAMLTQRPTVTPSKIALLRPMPTPSVAQEALAPPPQCNTPAKIRALLEAVGPKTQCCAKMEPLTGDPKADNATTLIYMLAYAEERGLLPADLDNDPDPQGTANKVCAALVAEATGAPEKKKVPTWLLVAGGAAVIGGVAYLATRR